MTLVEQNKRQKVKNLLEYVNGLVGVIDKALVDEADKQGKITPAWKGQRDAVAKKELKNIIKALGWLKGNLSIQGNIPPFNDQQIDLLGLDIRVFDDGQ